MARAALFIFARAPAYGAVKTRLARDIGVGAALRFHRQSLATVVRRFSGTPGLEVILAVTPRHRLADAAWPQGVARIDQGRGDLGQRMLRVLRHAGHRPALLIGSDIPEAGVHHLREALGHLARARFVLGPTVDGGYWLIGTSRPSLLSTRLLDGVRWSTPHALADTMHRLGGAAVLGERLVDVDDGAAWSRVQARQQVSQAGNV